MFYQVFLFLFVCLSVWLLATSRKKTTDRIFMKILPEMCLLDIEELIRFRKSSTPGSGSRNFSKDCSALRDRAFPTIWLVSLENWPYLRENFIMDVSSDKELINTKFRESSGCGLRMLTGFVLAEYRVLSLIFALLDLLYTSAKYEDIAWREIGVNGFDNGRMTLEI